MTAETAVSLQREIENRYGVKMHPNRSTFHVNLLDYYSRKKKLTESQLACLKNPKYPIKGI